MESGDTLPLRRVLFDLHGVRVRLPDDTRLGPISWRLERGRRIGVRCAHPEQWKALVDLFTGLRPPEAGRMEELQTVKVQTDLRAREAVQPNQILREYLHSPDVPEYVWLDGRRRALGVLVDLLGISPAMTRRALKFGPPELLDKVWALRFMLSQAHLLLARDLFMLSDPQVRTALRRRWRDFPGTLVACDGPAGLPAPPDAWVEFDAQGLFSGPLPVAPPEAEGEPKGLP